MNHGKSGEGKRERNLPELPWLIFTTFLRQQMNRTISLGPQILSTTYITLVVDEPPPGKPGY